MFTTLEEYYQNYRVKNGQVPNEVTLNRGPFRLKREIRELKSITDVVIGNDIETWNKDKFYEQDEYVQYNGKIYKSDVDGNHNLEPGVSIDWTLVEIVSLKSLLKRIEELEKRI